MDGKSCSWGVDWGNEAVLLSKPWTQDRKVHKTRVGMARQPVCSPGTWKAESQNLGNTPAS